MSHQMNILSSRTEQVSLSAFAFLYSELVQYHQSRVSSISELEQRLVRSGYGVGFKVLELLSYRSREVSLNSLYTNVNMDVVSFYKLIL